MAWTLARVVRPEGERWRISLRGAERIDHLPDGDALRPGELVLLEGEPGDWRALRGPLHAGPWSSAWRLQALTPEEKRLSPLFSARGDWVIDPDGLPVEHGLLRVGPDSFAHVLSYAGWRLGDLEGQELSFEQYTLEDLQLLVLRAEGCPEPEDAGEALPRDPLPRFEELKPVVLVPPRAPEPPPELPPEPPPVAEAPKPPPSQLGLFGLG